MTTDQQSGTQFASKQYTAEPMLESITRLAGVKTPTQLNEASLTVNGSAQEIAELMRMMQLAGAPGAKPVDVDDINPGPKPCPICGKIHGPMPKPGGCGSEPMQGPKEPDMGSMLRMMSAEEVATEEVEDGDFQDATTSPEPDYYQDVSASIPDGTDLHRSKDRKAIRTVNPALETSLKANLLKALSEKKAKPDFLDVDGDGDKKEPMKKALKDKKKK